MSYSHDGREQAMQPYAGDQVTDGTGDIKTEPNEEEAYSRDMIQHHIKSEPPDDIADTESFPPSAQPGISHEGIRGRNLSVLSGAESETETGAICGPDVFVIKTEMPGVVKTEPDADTTVIKTEPDTEIPVEMNTELGSDTKYIKTEPDSEMPAVINTVPYADTNGMKTELDSDTNHIKAETDSDSDSEMIIMNAQRPNDTELEPRMLIRSDGQGSVSLPVTSMAEYTWDQIRQNQNEGKVPKREPNGNAVGGLLKIDVEDPIHGHMMQVQGNQELRPSVPYVEPSSPPLNTPSPSQAAIEGTWPGSAENGGETRYLPQQYGVAHGTPNTWTQYQHVRMGVGPHIHTNGTSSPGTSNSSSSPCSPVMQSDGLTSDNRYMCDMCGKVLKTKSSLTRHKRLHADETLCRCCMCANVFCVKANAVKDNIFNGGQFMCDMCQKTHAVNAYFEKHKKKVKTLCEDRPYGCNYCEKAFKLKDDVLQHERLHTGDTFKCQYCVKEFTRKAALNRHERMHTGDRPHKCEECSKAYFTQGELKLHMRKHTGERPFKCLLCPKAFTCRKILNLHVKLHSEERPFECEKCGESFKIKAGLNRHMHIHKGVRPFKCEICDDVFSREDYLSKHRTTHRLSTS